MKTSTQLLTFTTILLCLTAAATAWNDGYGPISDGYFSVHFTGQDQLDRLFEIHGDNQPTVSTRMLPCDETHWISTDSWLPYVVSCRGGANFCSNKLSYNDDWMAIKYSNQLVNVQTDTRCGHVDDSYFDHYRCIIMV